MPRYQYLKAGDYIGTRSGLGNHVAKKFGENNFCVVSMARNEKSLMNYQKEFEKLKIETYIYPVDILFVQALERYQIDVVRVLYRKFFTPFFKYKAQIKIY